MKILFVENFDMKGDNPMSTLYPQRCNKIADESIFDTYDISKNLDVNMLNKYNKVLLGARALHFYKRYNANDKKIVLKKVEELMKINDKFFLIQDMHEKTYGCIDKLCEFLNNNNINIIFTFYNNTEARKIRKNTPNCKYYHLPLHIDTEIFHNKNSEKVYDILLYGSIHPRHYPFRRRLFELITKNSDKYRVMKIDKPEIFDIDKCENGLCEIINKSKISIATRSRYDYLVAKYLEIVNCGSVICGNMASDGKQIYGNNYLRIEENMTDDEIINVIDIFLENYEKNRDSMNSIYNIAQEYNLDNYVKKIVDIVNK